MQQELQCRRCWHRWKRRLAGRMPVACPRCKSTLWKTERTRGRGRPKEEHDLESLQVVEAETALTAGTGGDSVVPGQDFVDAVGRASCEPVVQPHPAGCSCTLCLWAAGGFR